MEQSAGHIFIRTLDHRVFVRIEGRATHIQAAPFQTFAKQMLGSGHDAFELDLGPCCSMDSTFLGVLVGLSIKLEKLGRAKPVIFRAAPCTHELLATLGVERFFELNRPVEALLDGGFDELSAPSCTATDWAPTIIAAHQLLVEVDDRNGPRFQDLLEFMRHDAVKAPARVAPTLDDDSKPPRWKQ